MEMGRLRLQDSFWLVLQSSFSVNSEAFAVWKQATSPQHNLWRMWRRFAFTTCLVFTAVLFLRIILLQVYIQTEVYDSWYWERGNKNTAHCGDCEHIRPQICLLWPVCNTCIHRFSAVVISPEVMQPLDKQETTRMWGAGRTYPVSFFLCFPVFVNVTLWKVHVTHLFLVIGGQNYKKIWKHSVVGFMTRKKINLTWKNSDVYLGEDEIETSGDLHVIPPPGFWVFA